MSDVAPLTPADLRVGLLRAQLWWYCKVCGKHKVGVMLMNDGQILYACPDYKSPDHEESTHE